MKTQWAALAALMLSQGAVALHQIDTIERSLTGSPEIIALGFQVVPSWRLSFEARFANECLADSGLVANYIDLPGQVSKPPRTRIFLVTQSRSEEGCPDIYMPVVRSFVAEMPAEATLKQLVVIDYVGKKPAADLEHQTFAFDLTRPPTRDAVVPVVPSSEFVKSELLYGSDPMPLVSRLRVALRSSEMDEAFLSYRIDFDVEFPTTCHAARGIVAQFFESRTGISDRTGKPVIDWLFIVNRGGAICSASSKAQVKRRYFIERRVSPDYRRKLVVVNPVTDRTPNLLKSFQSYDIK